MSPRARAALRKMASSNRDVSQDLQSAWTIPRPDLLDRLHTSPNGLAQDEADRRIGQYGPNRLKKGKRSDPITLLLAQFKSPIILILIFAGTLQRRWRRRLSKEE